MEVSETSAGEDAFEPPGESDESVMKYAGLCMPVGTNAGPLRGTTQQLVHQSKGLTYQSHPKSDCIFRTQTLAHGYSNCGFFQSF